MKEPLLYTMVEAASLLRISKAKMYGLVGEKAIASVRVGRCRRVRREDLEAYVNALGDGMATTRVSAVAESGLPHS